MSDESSSSSSQSQPQEFDRYSQLNPNLRRLQKQLEQQQKMNEAIQRAMSESCTTKTLMAGAAGGLFGSFFSLFMSSMGPISLPGQVEEEKFSWRKYAIETRGRMWSSAKAFGGIGMLYSLFECNLEKYRAQHDLINTFAAGCGAGGLLGIRAGPQAAALGCAGFAAFSMLIDYVMAH